MPLLGELNDGIVQLPLREFYNPCGLPLTFIPWMQVTDALLGHLGFMPGERVYFSVDYIKRHIFIRQAFD